MSQAGNSNPALVTEDSELLAHYLCYTEEALAELTSTLQNPGNPADQAAALHATAHNIKGMGTSFGFPLMTEVGTLLCGYLRGLAENAPLDRELIADHLTAMNVIIENRITGDGGDTGSELIRRLQERIDLVESSKTS